MCPLRRHLVWSMKCSIDTDLRRQLGFNVREGFGQLRKVMQFFRTWKVMVEERSVKMAMEEFWIFLRKF